MNTTPKTPIEMAFLEAEQAFERGEVPVGAVITHHHQIIAKAGNEIIARKDPTAHAEILVIREASRLLNNERLMECDLYVTLEPCTMCAGAISFARLRRIYYGASDEKGGGIDFFAGKNCHHSPEIYEGFMEQQSRELLQRFFKERR